MQPCARVIKDDEASAGAAVVGCVGAEVQTFKGTVPLRRAEDDTKGEVVDRPVIANLATGLSARRKGLAKRLMAAAEEQCVEWGFDEAVLIVESSNTKALDLYKKVRRVWRVSILIPFQLVGA
jgi:ribosomal protein S18 acetylase RimI-like enzyme